MQLKEKRCVPCSGDEKPLGRSEIEEFRAKLKKSWKVIDDKKIKKTFPFDNFNEGMEFARKVADVAEEEQHHPDLYIQYKSVDVEITTHAIGGLSENDFILGAKIDDL